MALSREGTQSAGDLRRTLTSFNLPVYRLGVVELIRRLGEAGSGPRLREASLNREILEGFLELLCATASEPHPYALTRAAIALASRCSAGISCRNYWPAAREVHSMGPSNIRWRSVGGRGHAGSRQGLSAAPKGSQAAANPEAGARRAEDKSLQPD